jgi:hypothetical protein
MKHHCEVIPEIRVDKTERPGFGPASIRWRETFSLNGSLSSPQQPLAIARHFIQNSEFVNANRIKK